MLYIKNGVFLIALNVKMKLPKTFRPEKNLDEKTKDLLENKPGYNPISGNLEEDIYNGFKDYLDMRENKMFNYTLCIHDYDSKDRFEKVSDAISKACVKGDIAIPFDAWVLTNLFDSSNMFKIVGVISQAKENYNFVQIAYMSEESFNGLADSSHGDYIIDKMYFLHIYDIDDDTKGI